MLQLLIFYANLKKKKELDLMCWHSASVSVTVAALTCLQLKATWSLGFQK